MRITNFRLLPDPGGGAIARFDVQITADVRLCNWLLKANDAGAYRVFPPSSRQVGTPAVIVSPPTFARIQAAAIDELGGRSAHDHLDAAA